jgi:hypothetical protein
MVALQLSLSGVDSDTHLETCRDRVLASAARLTEQLGGQTPRFA